MEKPSPTTPLATDVRRIDLVFPAVVAVVCVVLWLFLPAEWSPAHVGGKWFLLVFVITSGLAALLTSAFLLGRGTRTKDDPAVWLGIQVLFWNPLAYRAVLALVEAVGLPSDYGAVVALVGLVLLGLPTSLLGVALCRSPSWIAVYVTRAIECLFATWIPLLPTLIFLHVLLFAQLVTWNRYGWLQKLAVSLIVAEQLLAFLWVLLFNQIQ